jgi:hypothetical protein
MDKEIEVVSAADSAGRIDWNLEILFASVAGRIDWNLELEFVSAAGRIDLNE